MAISNTDTFENRKKLESWIEEQGSNTFIQHGYNLVKDAVVLNYGKVQVSSNGMQDVLKMTLDISKHNIPSSEKYVIVSVAKTDELQDAIDLIVDQFFSPQKSIDDGPDEHWVLHKVSSLQEDYRKEYRIKEPVEAIITVKSFSRSNNKMAIQGYVSEPEAWARWKSIALYSEERKVVVMNFDEWMKWLEFTDRPRYNKITEELANEQEQ